MRLLLVGGEDIHLRLSFVKMLQAKGITVALAAPEFHPSLRGQQIDLLSYPLVRNIHPLKDFKSIGSLRRIVSDWAPDCVHTFDTKPNYLLPLAMHNSSDVRVVRTLNGMGRAFSSGGLKNLTIRQIYKMLHRRVRERVDHTIFQNTDDQSYFLQKNLVNPDRISLIKGSGIDVEGLTQNQTLLSRATARKALDLLNTDIVFILVARLVREKGIIEYLEMARRMRVVAPQAKFLLVGSYGGSEDGSITAPDLDGYAADVRYLGRRDDVPSLLNAADVFVLPTAYREGVPRSMLEAMASGLPVIVGDVPGCRDAVGDGSCGWLVPPKDISALVDAGQEALVADRATLGKNAAQAIRDHYELKQVFRATLDVYAVS